MNLNAFLGMIGLSLLVFVAAFAIGRHTRPVPAPRSQVTQEVVGVDSNDPSPPTVSDATLDTMTDAASAQDSLLSASSPQLPTDMAAEEEVEAEPVSPPAAPKPAEPTPAERAARQRAAENRIAIAARRAHADQLPDDFKKYYAQELPEDAISEEQDVQTSITGQQADVITLTSRAFNATNKDFVLQQVRSELTALGFKRLYITDGRGFKTSVSL